MRTQEGKVKVDHPRSKSQASQTRKRREGFSVPTGRSRFEKVFALYMSPAGRRGRTEEQIMLNQARYFLPGMTSDNCQKNRPMEFQYLYHVERKWGKIPAFPRGQPEC